LLSIFSEQDYFFPGRAHAVSKPAEEVAPYGAHLAWILGQHIVVHNGVLEDLFQLLDFSETWPAWGNSKMRLVARHQDSEGSAHEKILDQADLSQHNPVPISYRATSRESVALWLENKPIQTPFCFLAQEMGQTTGIDLVFSLQTAEEPKMRVLVWIIKSGDLSDDEITSPESAAAKLTNLFPQELGAYDGVIYAIGGYTDPKALSIGALDLPTTKRTERIARLRLDKLNQFLSPGELEIIKGRFQYLLKKEEKALHESQETQKLKRA
jgi:hypothetical protein